MVSAVAAPVLAFRSRRAVAETEQQTVLDVPASHTAVLPAAPVPAGMKLLQLHVVFRHGEKFFGDRRNKNFPSYPLECPQDGDLTEQGIVRMRHLGAQLRVVCANLGEPSPETDDVYLFCCNAGGPGTRHYESLRHVYVGLWPQHVYELEQLDVRLPGSRLPERDGVTIFEKTRNSKILEDHELTKRLEELWSSWRAGHAAELSEAAQPPAIARLVAEATKHKGTHWALGKPDGPMHVLCIRLAYSMQHGERLPEGVSTADYIEVSRACHAEDFEYFQQEEAARLYVGGFFGDLLKMGSRALSGGAAPRMCLYASHDYAVGPLAAALAAPFGQWPDVGSFVMFELLQEPATGGAFVRVTRNSKVVPNILGLEARPDGLVPWSDFVKKLQQRVLSSLPSRL